jgi:hypothetical protein
MPLEKGHCLMPSRAPLPRARGPGGFSTPENFFPQGFLRWHGFFPSGCLRAGECSTAPPPTSFPSPTGLCVSTRPVRGAASAYGGRLWLVTTAESHKGRRHAFCPPRPCGSGRAPAPPLRRPGSARSAAPKGLTRKHDLCVGHEGPKRPLSWSPGERSQASYYIVRHARSALAALCLLVRTSARMRVPCGPRLACLHATHGVK